MIDFIVLSYETTDETAMGSMRPVVSVFLSRSRSWSHRKSLIVNAGLVGLMGSIHKRNRRAVGVVVGAGERACQDAGRKTGMTRPRLRQPSATDQSLTMERSIVNDGKRPCLNPFCTRQIETRPGAPRPRLFCSNRCKMDHWLLVRAGELILPLGPSKGWEILQGLSKPHCGDGAVKPEPIGTGVL